MLRVKNGNPRNISAGSDETWDRVFAIVGLELVAITPEQKAMLETHEPMSTANDKAATGENEK